MEEFLSLKISKLGQNDSLEAKLKPSLLTLFRKNLLYSIKKEIITLEDLK